MEPVSFAVGLVGLAGAFTSGIDILTRVKRYRKFQDDNRVLSARFSRARYRFEQWGERLGLPQQADKFVPGEKSFDETTQGDSKLEKLVLEHLDIIQSLFPSEHEPSNSSRPGSSVSKRTRFSWAAGGKEVRSEHVEALEVLVQNLYELLPPESSPENVVMDPAVLSNIQVLQDMLSEMADKAAGRFHLIPM